MKEPFRPIGIFDSGLGGISVLAEAMRLMPTENYLYYGDTGFSPYGEKSPQEVLNRIQEILDHLLAAGCKAVLIACNTATSVAGPLRQEIQLPIIGMEPALKPASLLPEPGNVLVLATQMTLSQPKFEKLMEKYGQDAVPIPCPELVTCVEAGEIWGEYVESTIRRLLAPHLTQRVKAVVLGCTHFVFLRESIEKVLGDIPLVDGNKGTVQQLMRRMKQEGMLCSSKGQKGSVSFETSANNVTEALQRMDYMLQVALHK